MHPAASLPGRIAAGVVAFALVFTGVLGPVPVAFAEEQVAGVKPAAKPVTLQELPQKRTANTRTYGRSDGTFETRIYGAPVNYQDTKTGRFEPIDTGLDATVTAQGKAWKNRGNSFDLTIPRTGGRDFVRIARGPRALAWRPVSRLERDVARSVETTGEVLAREGAPTVQYEAAYPDGRLELESNPHGVKESIVLDRYTEASTFSFDVAATGLRPRLEASGSITWLDSANGTETVYVMPAPWMADSRPEEDGGQSISYDVRYVLTPQGAGWRLDIVADAEWLDDPTRVYPVTIDPTVHTRYADQCGWYYSSGPNGSYTDTVDGGTNADHHKVCFGYKNAYGYGTFFSLIRLGGLHAGSWWDQAADAGYQILDSKLNLYCFYDYNSAADDWAQVRGVASYWTQGTATYNNQPLYDAGVVDSIQNRAEQWMVFNVTSKVREWVTNHGEGAYGFRVQAVGGSSYAKYESAWGNLPALVPYLTVTYASRPVAAVTSPSTGASVFPMGAPRTSWSYSDTSGFPQTEFKVSTLDAAGTTVLATNSGSGGATNAAIPTPQRGFIAGTSYKVRVEVASNPQGTQPLWSLPSTPVTFTMASGPQPSFATTSSPSWFEETDADSDGAPDNRCDDNSSGRGSVVASWTAQGWESGYGVYISDGSQWRQVATTTIPAWTSAGAGLYPADSTIASRSTDATSSPYLAGTGLDLRDDPTPFYAKTPGSALDVFPGYALKIVPYSAAGGLTLSDCPTATVQLPSRTRSIDEPRADTAADLGAFAGHSVRSLLDSAAGDPARLELSVTDLAIASWGPEAALSRTYRSDVTTSSSFAPGWRFSYEQCISTEASAAVWTDATGAQVRFREDASGDYVAPRSVVATLAHLYFAPTAWILDLKGGTTLSFDQAGRITSEKDRNGCEVTYTRPTDAVIITADNGQTIQVNLEGTRVVAATYAGDAGQAREVHYEYAGGSEATVTPGADTSSAVVYRFDDAGRLSSTGVPCFAGTDEQPAEWGFAYVGDGSALSSVRYPGYAADEHRRGDITYPGNDSAVLTRFGTVDGTADTPVATTWTWYPTGAMDAQSNPGSTTALTTYEYNVLGEVCSERSPMGKTTRTETDARGNVIGSTDEGGRITRTVYSGDDAVSSTDPNGSVTTYGYDTRGNVTLEQKTLDESGRYSSTESTYTAEGLLREKRSKISTDTWAVTEYCDFASNGQARTTIERDVKLSPDAQAIDLERHSTYRWDGALLTETAMHASESAETRVASNTVDAVGRVTASEDASGVVANTLYDALGNVRETWRSHESTTTTIDRRAMEYDSAGRLVLERRLDSDGSVVSSVTHVYDTMDRELRSDDSATPGFSETRYDAAGSATKVWSEGADTSKDDASTRTVSNADGAQTEQRAPGATDAATVTNYAPDGNVESEQQPDGSSTEYEYDESGELESETEPTDAGDATTRYVTDLDGTTVKVIAPNNSETSSDYDLLGRLVGTRAGTQQMTTITYNVLGQVLSSTDFDGVNKSYVYDAAGRVLQENIGGLVTATSYDSCGRELRRTNPDGSSAITERDVFGRVAWVAQTGTDGAAAHATSTTLDDAGRPTRVADTVSGLVRTWAYGPSGESTMTETRPGQGTVVTVTDGTGLLVRVDADVLGAYANWGVLSKDAAGRVTNAWSSTFQNDWALEYDQAGRPVRARGTAPEEGGVHAAGIPPEPAPDDSLTYTYNSTTGAKTRDSFGFASGSESTTYTYTLTGRLGSALVNGALTTYDYDPISGALRGYRKPNETTTSLTYDPSTGRLLTAGSRYYRSDSLGRRIGSGVTAVTTDTVYGWSGERLTSYAKSPTAASYAYDASGQRTRSTVTQGSLITTTTWLYDGSNLLGCTAQRSDGTTWSVSYLRDERGGVFAGVYAATAVAPTRFLMVTTDRGDVRELVDPRGEAFALYSYDAFGNPRSTIPSSTPDVSAALASAITARQPLRYASYTWDAESSLYYCSQRYYDPSAAAFISKDPARADGEESAYQYCGGDPVGKTDPSGLMHTPQHRALTTLWAISEKFSVRDAKIIGQGSWEVDGLKQYNGRKHPDYHFAPAALSKAAAFLGEAIRLRGRKRTVSSGLNRRALLALGHATHCVQDTVAHGWFNERGRRYEDAGQDVDDYYKWPASTRGRQCDWTVALLRRYRSAAGLPLRTPGR